MTFVDSLFDESGTHAGSSFVVLAGFADFAENWLSFSIDWGLHLHAYLSIDYFPLQLSPILRNGIEVPPPWQK